MRILTRYILRAHLGPFVFALSVLTGLLFVNTIARRLPDLAGKGLPLDVFLKVGLYSLPHIIALTLPMAVLVAVLYAYSQLAADNEVTALKASGVNMLRLLVPVLGMATLLAVFMIWFNDRVLPETNHALKNLLGNIAAKAPTLEMREQVVNPVASTDFSSRVYIRPGEIDHATGRMKDVTIFDLSDQRYRRTIYADSGRLAFDQDTIDLYLTLYDGTLYEVPQNNPGAFERMRFEKQVSVVRDVGSKFDAASTDEYRSDREMSLEQLSTQIDSTRRELAATLGMLRSEAAIAVDRTLQGPAATAVAEEAELRSGGAAIRSIDPDAAYRTSYGSSVGATGDPVIDRASNEVRAHANRAQSLRNRINQYEVEYHKKFAIPFACLIFVLIGAPLAVRFPRGGAGMVIMISLAIFGIYYVSLIGGETLGDDGKIRSFVGPWAPNMLFGAIALFALTRIGRETSTTRGGDWDDLWRTTVGIVTRPFRRRPRRPAPATSTGAGD